MKEKLNEDRNLLIYDKSVFLNHFGINYLQSNMLLILAHRKSNESLILKLKFDNFSS